MGYLQKVKAIEAKGLDSSQDHVNIFGLHKRLAKKDLENVEIIDLFHGVDPSKEEFADRIATYLKKWRGYR